MVWVLPHATVPHYYPDLLHEYLNQFNGALEEAFQSHLELEQYKDQPEIKQKAIDVTIELNARILGWVAGSKQHRELLVTFGGDNRRWVVDGPEMKAMMRDPLLPAEGHD